MNDMIVGMENLPNVFIHKVQVHSRSNGFRIKTSLRMYDYSSNESWKGRIDDLKVKISYVSDKSSMDDLDNGIASLYDYRVGETRTKIVSTSLFNKIDTLGNFSVFSFVVEENLPFNPTDLNIYTACFIDDLGFENPLFDKFYGPMSGERIFVGGNINSLSNYFYFPDTNEEYGGPVHQKTDGTYMEGSVHTESPHKDLVLVTEENYKIQSYNNSSLIPNNSPRDYS